MARTQPGEKPAQKRRRSAGSRPASGELAIIERIRKAAQATHTRTGALRLGIGDDCALLRTRLGEEIAVTTDFSLEGRHFRRDWHRPASVGHRVLARGLSDLAAMGARPIAAFLSLALPRTVAQDGPWLDGFLKGFLALAERFRVPLAGGDTSEAPDEHILADVMLLGAVPQGRALRRDAVRPGDRLFVTGRLGGAAAELETLAQRGSADQPSQASQNGMHPHLFPEPRVHVGLTLVKRRLSAAAMDLSDGLSTDLHHMLRASDVAAEIEQDRLPLHPLLDGRSRSQSLAAALHGGEDYELLFAARPGLRMPGRIAGVPLTEIGRIVARRRGRPLASLVDSQGRATALEPQGWEHLR